MILKLKSASSSASVDTNGAWLVSLNYDEAPLLFPKSTLHDSEGNIKVRGGCHVCFPNFGPGGDSDLPQHGPARDLEWRVIDTTGNTVTLELNVNESLVAQLNYSLGHNYLSMNLLVSNAGDAPERVSPGFHPYFMYINPETVKVNDSPVTYDSLPEVTFFQNSKGVRLAIDGKTLHLSSKNLPLWAQWSDNLDNYLCIEPTHAGFSFLKAATKEEMLEAGTSQIYNMRIEFS